MQAATEIRKDFPILNRTNSSGKKLVYLDNAASTQKPIQVIDAISDYYKNHHSNVHRGIHFLGVEATELYEQGREKAKQFINASSEEEIIFVRGTTEGINLVAQSYVRPLLKPGDHILISGMEHHSNLVPWQAIAQEKKAILDVMTVTSQGEIELEDFKSKLSSKTRIVAVTHISNTLGTINPIREMAHLAHQNDIPVLIDGAQAAGHQPVDVADLDCDFYAFSSHKMYGPTGIGVLYAKKKTLEKMSPYQFGGEMIRSVKYDQTTYADLPHRFEAGTPNVAGVVGMNAAIDYLLNIDLGQVKTYTEQLTGTLLNELRSIPGISIIGEPSDRASIVSFIHELAHPHDVATILDEDAVAVRAGHHCNMPLMTHLGIPGTIRASLSFYNDENDIYRLIESLKKVNKIFK